MSDDDILLRAVVALERIADAQEAMVARPAPLRTAEKRLEVAIEANEKLIASAVKESVKPKSTTEEVPKKVELFHTFLRLLIKSS